MNGSLLVHAGRTREQGEARLVCLRGNNPDRKADGGTHRVWLHSDHEAGNLVGTLAGAGDEVQSIANGWFEIGVNKHSGLAYVANHGDVRGTSPGYGARSQNQVALRSSAFLGSD